MSQLIAILFRVTLSLSEEWYDVILINAVLCGFCETTEPQLNSTLMNKVSNTCLIFVYISEYTSSDDDSLACETCAGSSKSATITYPTSALRSKMDICFRITLFINMNTTMLPKTIPMVTSTTRTTRRTTTITAWPLLSLPPPPWHRRPPLSHAPQETPCRQPRQVQSQAPAEFVEFKQM